MDPVFMDFSLSGMIRDLIKPFGREQKGKKMKHELKDLCSNPCSE